MFDYIKNTNTGITGVSRKEKRKRKGSQNVFDKLMAENFPNLNKKTNSGARSKSIPPKLQQQDSHQYTSIKTAILKIWVSKGSKSKTVSCEKEPCKSVS